MAEPHDYYRGPDGLLVHGPDCLPPSKYYPKWTCMCDWMEPHQFIPHRPPHHEDCHECGLKADDPMHRGQSSAEAGK